MGHDPVFWGVAVFSVLITGVSKGGFGGLALFAVPLMALVISPIQAAGIMLPILIVMDWVGVWTYRKHWDRKLLVLLLPGAILGIAAGGLATGTAGAVLNSDGTPIEGLYAPVPLMLRRWRRAGLTRLWAASD